MKSNILAVGSHPDDVELGCGATLAKHIELGNQVYALILTKGESGGHHAQQEECHEAMKRLGIKDYFFGNFRDGSVSDGVETVSFIEKTINRLNIDTVYVHDPHDRHQDHRNCSKAVSSAARKVPTILLYEGPSTEVTFEPHYFIEVSQNHLDAKIEALEKYGTQIGKGIVNLDRLRALSVVRGNFCNAKLAEAFAVNHISRGGTYV